QWRDYQERGLVKHGSEWVTPAERDARLQESFLAVNDVRMQIKQGDAAGARQSLRRMLEDDADDVSALYLSAVLALRERDIGRARGDFERVRAREPKHAPTLVNLAVISIEQNQHPRALTLLAEAMNRQPENRQ